MPRPVKPRLALGPCVSLLLHDCGKLGVCRPKFGRARLGKKLTILGFIVSMGIAIYVFMTRDTTSLRKNLDKASAKEPRAVLEDFTVYRYEGNVLKSKLTARLGHFYEPNVVELDGEIRGERLTNEGDKETVGAESATAYFKATSLTKMLDQNQPTELDRAELTGFVEVGVKEHLLTTDYAEYINSEKLVRSLRPVRVEGPGRVFTGEDGFTYDLLTQVLDMQGQVKGDIELDHADHDQK